VVWAGSWLPSTGALVTMTMPCGSGTGRGPKFVIDRQPPGRVKCSTWLPVPGIQSMDSEVCSLCRQLSAWRYIDNVDAGSCFCASTLNEENQSGWGKWARPGPKPNDGPSSVHGSGTRQPSRPFSAS